MRYLSTDLGPWVGTCRQDAGWHHGTWGHAVLVIALFMTPVWLALLAMLVEWLRARVRVPTARVVRR